MHLNRLRGGALAWLLTLQFFVVETIAQLRLDAPYSRGRDVISDLGTADSPAHQWMNASFVLQAALIATGVLLLRPVLRGAAGATAAVFLGVAAAGALLVGVFPSDGNGTLHGTGAVLYLVGGGLGLLALAYAIRPRSEALGTTLALLGLVATSMTIFFITGVTEFLGDGGTERAAAYALPIGLALAGAALWWMGATGPAPTTPRGRRRAARRAEREQARAERAAQARARDTALEVDATLEEAARRDRSTPDDDDPWAPQRRRPE